MRLDRAARKEIRWPFTADVPITSADVYLDGTWHTGTVEGSEVVLLVAGPDAEDNPGGTVVLPLGGYWPRIRFVDNPEINVEDGGFILVE